MESACLWYPQEPWLLFLQPLLTPVMQHSSGWDRKEEGLFGSTAEKKQLTTHLPLPSVRNHRWKSSVLALSSDSLGWSDMDKVNCSSHMFQHIQFWIHLLQQYAQTSLLDSLISTKASLSMSYYVSDLWEKSKISILGHYQETSNNRCCQGFGEREILVHS